MPNRCCVPGCDNESNRMHHTFPNDEQLMIEWCTAIGREDLLAKGVAFRRNYRVCGIHFDDDSKFPFYHNRTNLKVGSVPKLHLPPRKAHSDIMKQHNSNGGDFAVKTQKTEVQRPVINNDIVQVKFRSPVASSILSEKDWAIIKNAHRTALITPTVASVSVTDKSSESISNSPPPLLTFKKRKFEEQVVQSEEEITSDIKEEPTQITQSNKYFSEYLACELSKLPEDVAEQFKDDIMSQLIDIIRKMRDLNIHTNK